MSDYYSILELCNELNVNRSGYYKWLKRHKNPSKKEIQRREDIELVKEVHKKHPSHGYRWIAGYLRNKRYKQFTDDHTFRCCKYGGIISQGNHYRWKKPGEEQIKYPNLIWNGWEDVKGPLKVIVSDMTSFRVKGIYYELTMYFDVWNKEILGYGLDARKGSTTTYYKGLTPILKIKKEEYKDQETILHTDQGSVYSSKEYNSLIQEYNIKRSMSRAGTPTDNPVNESLNGWIKEELFIDFNLKQCDDIPKLIEEYIYFYNHERPSYALQYKTPIQFKEEYESKQKKETNQV